jgi:hypothetical protein
LDLSNFVCLGAGVDELINEFAGIAPHNDPPERSLA